LRPCFVVKNATSLIRAPPFCAIMRGGFEMRNTEFNKFRIVT
jgi:hypothetical protein